MRPDDREQRPEPPARDDAEDERDRRFANLFLLGFFVVVVGIGVWLANAMIDYRKLDDCIAHRQRNCAPIETPSR